MAGDMDLDYGCGRERVQIRDRVEAQIPRRDVDIVDVAEQPAAGPPRQLGQELRLWNGRVAEPEITRRILDQDAVAKRLLNLVGMRRDHGQGLIRVGKREQVVEVGASGRAPREVLGNEAGLDPVDQGLEPLEVPPVGLACAAEREADTVEGNGIVAPRGLECGEGGAAHHVVLGMNLEPWDGGASGQQLADMRSSEAYARTGFRAAWAVVRAHGTRPRPS